MLMGLASRELGVPVRWIEDRLKHLAASSASSGRVTTVEAGFTTDGELVALRYDAVEDVGAYVRAPEPATLYRMHGSLAGAYRVRNAAARNRIVLTNTLPSGLNRGFGGPQLYLALERAMTIARDLAKGFRHALAGDARDPFEGPEVGRGGLGDSRSEPFVLGVLRDVTERRKAEERVQESCREAEKALEGTIQAIRAMVDMRDRYTAGHQLRVTELACAMAEAMGLSGQQVQAIHVAGLLHDVGKMLLPTELLIKPGRLNDIEFAMVRTHAKAGYNILKSIEFPWSDSQDCASAS